MKEGFAFHEIITDNEGKAVDYRFLSINPAFEEYTGISAEKAEGRTVKELFPEIEDYWIEIYGNAALRGETVSFENYSKDIDKYFSCSAFSPEKGFFAVLFMDITEQKKMGNMLAEEKEQLSVTLRSIGDGVISTDRFGNVTLLNNVAEELTGWTTEEAFGKPLCDVFNIVNEFSGEKCENTVDKVISTGEIVELANPTCLISKEGHEYIIEDSAAPIRNIDNEILGVVLVFRDSTEKKNLEKSAIMNQRLESLGVLAGGLAHDFNNLLGCLYGYIELAKLNSEINNDKYKIEDSAECRNFVKLVFSDTGIGIPKECLKKILDPFFSTKQAAHGLGLSTVYSIIKYHDGYINIKSEPGKGPDIEILLPVYCENPIRELNKKSDSVFNSSGKILVMDDDESIREVLKEMLESFDYSVDAVSDGEEAVDMITESIDKEEAYTACILDLTVPGGLGGKEVVERITNLKEKMLVIASSGYSEDPVISNPSEYGFSASLTKPFMLEELISLLNQTLHTGD